MIYSDFSILIILLYFSLYFCHLYIELLLQMSPTYVLGSPSWQLQ